MKEKLPIYRHVVALIMVFLVGCYIFFYSEVEGDKVKKTEN